MKRLSLAVLVLVVSLPSWAEAQPIVPYGHAPIISTPAQPSTIIQRFGDGPILDGPRRPSPPGTKAPVNTPRPSPGDAGTTPEQRPLVCQTIGPRTICE